MLILISMSPRLWRSRWSPSSTSPATSCGVSGSPPPDKRRPRIPVMPVRKFLLPVFSGLMLLTLAFLPTALSAQQSTDPHLAESEAKQIASSYSNMQTIVSRHSILERHVNWDDSRRVWEVFWINPANYRKVVSVDVDDATAKVISVNIRPEAYGDILPCLLYTSPSPRD